jgi:ubiquitin-conjugating enzyme E2 R
MQSTRLTAPQLINENVFEWSVALIVLNEDSLYYGGYFKSKMTFPRNYPHSPPGTSLPAHARHCISCMSISSDKGTNSMIDFKFIRPLYHPNIYPDGRLCISILHPPGDDEMSGETAAERWSPVQRVETVLISILSLLDDAEVSSPANVDAGVMLRNKPDEYKGLATKDVETSKQDIPADFVMPTHETAWRKKEDEGDFEMSWEDSDVESFGGSESDLEDEEMDSDMETGDDDLEDEDEDL